MADIVKIKRGLDIPLAGKVAFPHTKDTQTDLFGIVPDDYPGTPWRLLVAEGDEVLKGTPLMQSKTFEAVRLVSPVAGKVERVERGERRKILSISVRAAASPDNQNPDLPTPPTADADSADIIDMLCRTGLWALMHRRPYDVIPRPEVTPRDIFITAFDSAPLAPEILTPDDLAPLEAGIRLLARLTSGRVYLGVRFGSGISSPTATTVEFSGSHPAGNVGVQIAAIKPVNKGETVWTLDARTVARIGRYMTSGDIDAAARVALTGEMCLRPRMVDTRVGACLHQLLEGSIADSGRHVRIISGNVLTGTPVTPADDFLRYPFRQVTLIPEGDNEADFMGWASLSPRRFSIKRSFPAFLRRGAEFSFDSRLKGGRRAMILSGEYDRVFPMDIYPEYLLRAILSGNIDRMEQLGIYEVAPEDFALPEFVDTSKMPLQQIVREGLERIRKEEEG